MLHIWDIGIQQVTQLILVLLCSIPRGHSTSFVSLPLSPSIMHNYDKDISGYNTVA